MSTGYHRACCDQSLWITPVLLDVWWRKKEEYVSKNAEFGDESHSHVFPVRTSNLNRQSNSPSIGRMISEKFRIRRPVIK